MTVDPAILRTVETAIDCGARPAMAFAIALAAAHPKSLMDAVAFVESMGPHWKTLSERNARMPTALAELEPALRLDPEIARIRPDVGDHELRGKLVFRDLVGKKSFIQVAALAIGGVELSASDAELLEHLGTNTQLADARIWPLTIVRRIAARSGMAHGILAGAAIALNPNMGAEPVGAFMRTLDVLSSGVAKGASIEGQLVEMTERGGKIPGVGRPVLGPDERNAQVFLLARRFGRDQGASFKLAGEVDAFFAKRKRQHINAAGLQGALMRDMEFSPGAATAFCLLYFLVPILAQAVVAEERLAE